MSNTSDPSRGQLLEQIHSLETRAKALADELENEKKVTRYLKGKLATAQKYEKELALSARAFEAMSVQFAQHVKSALALQIAIFAVEDTAIEKQLVHTESASSVFDHARRESVVAAGCKKVGWEFLRTFLPLREMPDSILIRLAEVTYELKRRPNQTIIRRGEGGAELFFLVKGSVSILNSEKEVCSLNAPTYFGDVGGFIECQRTSTVQAKTECDLLVLTVQKIWDVLKDSPEHEAKLKLFIERRRKWWDAQRTFRFHSEFGGEFFLEIARMDLLKLPIFESAEPTFLEDVISKINPEVHKANATIIAAGADSDCMYFIVHGSVRVVGKEAKIHAELLAGQFFGEIGIFLNVQRTANVVAQVDCYLLKLTKDALDAVSRSHPKMQPIIKQEADERYALVKKREEAAQKAASQAARTVATASVNATTAVVAAPMLEDIEISRQNLKRLGIFANIEASILTELALQMHQSTVNAGKYIIRCGDSADSMFFVAHGKVEIISEFDQVLDSAEGPTAYFGEVGLLEDTPRIASVRASTTCSIYTLKKSDLLQVFARCPEVEAKIRETAAERLQAHLMRNVLA